LSRLTAHHQEVLYMQQLVHVMLKLIQLFKINYVHCH
jgi:hypothetical protein